MNTDTEAYWLQIIFPEEKKVFSIDIQQEWRKGNGKFWIKYGDSVNSLTFYSKVNGFVKVSVINTCEVDQVGLVLTEIDLD